MTYFTPTVVVVDLGLHITKLTYCVLILDSVDVPECLINFLRKGEMFDHYQQ